VKLLFLGDIVGKPGRDAVLAHLPGLRRHLQPDFIIANGENAAHGFGITEKICTELFDAGIDMLTSGNHVWDQREALSFIEREPRLIRPRNFPPGTPGRGSGLYDAANGGRVLVINVMGRLFMDPLDDPFSALEQELAACPLKEAADAVVVDVHAEATSEKMSIGHFLDGRVSLVVGTHTHVPTSDTQILPGGTAYQTDAGACASYDSVIGMEKAIAVERFVRKLPSSRLEPASGEATLCGVFVQTDDATGLASSVSPVRVGGRLSEHLPAVSA
jgi:2',3'-cyclic-nucleotide 2'-phosphodiesterase